MTYPESIMTPLLLLLKNCKSEKSKKLTGTWGHNENRSGHNEKTETPRKS